MKLAEVSWSDANKYVARWHRHNAPVAGGYRGALVLDDSLWAHGAAIVGRPVSRILQERGYCEVTRVATDGARNACSMLYGWAARWAKRRALFVCTYTRADEPGTSLRAAGWEQTARTRPAKNGWNNRPGRGSHECIAKVRWSPSWVAQIEDLIKRDCDSARVEAFGKSALERKAREGV